jgi:DNA-binding response OmpR family regulator
VAFIVLADDDDIVCNVARDAFWRRGHVLGTVSDGNDVLKLLKRKQPDLVLLDCNMEPTSGLEVLRRMRNSNAYYRVPVIMLTARTSAEDKRIALSMGANGYVCKPFDPEELVFKVETLLQDRAATLEIARQASRPQSRYL